MKMTSASSFRTRMRAAASRVLIYGLTGVIAAFAAIALYLGFDRVSDKAAAALAQSPSAVLQSAAPYAGILFIGAVVGGLLLGLWNILAGQSENGSQTFMRLRVVGQFTLIAVIMAMLYVSSGA
jgi:hypothetical protein